MTGLTFLLLSAQAEALFPSKPLKLEGDLAGQMLDGAHRFLDQELVRAVNDRPKIWKGTPVKNLRNELSGILGIQDKRIPFEAPMLVATTATTALIATTENYKVFAVRWPVLKGVSGEGLLLEPVETAPVANIIVIPDAGQTPEQLAGMAPGNLPEMHFARRLAEAGCRVVVPALINRTIRAHKPWRRNIRISNRELLHRSAFLMGRTLQGYEIQKVLAIVDWFSSDRDARIGVAGWGEGGMMALRAAALDERIDATLDSGDFGPRENMWQEPLERNVFGFLTRFGDAGLTRMVSPRSLFIEAARSPDFVVNSHGAAPGRLVTPSLEDVKKELAAGKIFASQPEGQGPPGSTQALEAFLKALAPKSSLVKGHKPPPPPARLPDPQLRHDRSFKEIDAHIQNLVHSSHIMRSATFQPDLSSLEAFNKSTKPHRDRFRKEVIGSFEQPLLPPRPRSRQVYNMPKWTGHEVVLDVFPDLFAYGILLVPKDLQPKEKRPVIVCQHGLEGRPRDIIQGNHRAYHDFAAKLCEQGYVVFAPQNPYLMRDRFRSLQRKANPLGKTLFSLIVPQHQQIVNWLGSLPFTDPARIAFYGLSYGGKTAMRVPALVDGYCLSICSADFNDWIRKTGSTQPGDDHYSYPFTVEYEIFEFNLGHTFNYAEMAALIAPRPFMVERGHFDGVAPDEWVAAEYAKVRRLYTRLGIPEKTEIEWFLGPHTINGKGTFRFLDKWLNN